MLETCLLDGQLFCRNRGRCDKGHGGTVCPETGTKQIVKICAAGIHPRSCGVSYGRGTLQKIDRMNIYVIYRRNIFYEENEKDLPKMWM